jgi:hypothetical protein
MEWGSARVGRTALSSILLTLLTLFAGFQLLLKDLRWGDLSSFPQKRSRDSFTLGPMSPSEQLRLA